MTDDDNPFAQWERNFREQLRGLREARGWTQTDLARRLKDYGLPFHQQTVQRIETGERPVRLNEAHLIAQVLDVDVTSMTSTSTPSEREMHYALDAFRGRSETAAQYLRETIAEWVDDVGPLAAAISDRIEALPDENSPDELTRKGIGVAVQALWALGDLLSGYQQVARIGGASEQETYFSDDVMDVIEAWAEKYEDVMIIPKDEWGVNGGEHPEA